MFSFLVDFSRTVVVNVWASFGPFSPSCGLVFALFSVTNVLFSYQCPFQLPMFFSVTNVLFSFWCSIQLLMFVSVTDVLFSYWCSFQLPMFFSVSDLCSTVVGYVQSCSYFSRDTIQLAPSIESNVPPRCDRSSAQWVSFLSISVQHDLGRLTGVW